MTRLGEVQNVTWYFFREVEITIFCTSTCPPETSSQYIPNLTNFKNSSDYEVIILSNFSLCKPTLKITKVHEAANWNLVSKIFYCTHNLVISAPAKNSILPPGITTSSDKRILAMLLDLMICLLQS